MTSFSFQIGDKPNNEFEVLSKEFQNILFKGK